VKWSGSMKIDPASPVNNQPNHLLPVRTRNGPLRTPKGSTIPPPTTNPFIVAAHPRVSPGGFQPPPGGGLHFL
jgi:hypothetical protein